MAGKRPITIPAAVLAVGVIAGTALIMLTQTAFAAVGSGGDGGGGGGGEWGYTYYGHGWDSFSVNGGGPSAGFHTGTWNNVKNACKSDNASTVMVYVLGTASGKWMGYNYHSSYDGYSGGSPPGGVSSATAHSRYNSLPASDKRGYTWGTNVAWFCWDINPPKWGKMTATTSVNKTTVRPGQSVTWTHKVWDTGSVGNDKTDTISGDVYWNDNTTGPIPAGDKTSGALPQDVKPDKSYSRKFDKGQANGVTKSYTFTVPNSARNGNRYCQYINGDKTSSNSSANFNSKGTDNCVVVSVAPPTTPPPATSSASCSVSTHPGGYLEVNSSNFSATISSSVTKPSTRDNRNANGAGHVYTYSVINQKIVAHSDVPPASQTDTGHSSATFNYARQSVPSVYGVDGTYTYAIRMTDTNYVRHSVTTVDSRGRSHTTYYITSSSTNHDGAAQTVDCPPAYQTYIVKPYLQVTGGDVVSGTYPVANQAACATEGSGANAGKIIGWNSGSPSYNGSSVQYAAMANNLIQWFASAKASASTVPKGLSFANTAGAANSDPTYGGGFNGVSSNCDFAAEINSLPADHKLNGNVNASDLDYSGTYYINGNLTIDNDIQYDYTGQTDNPQFKVIVNGNINITGDVSELDGVYISQGGTINTCAGVGPSDRYAECNNSLTVYGALMGRTIDFYRTTGTLNGSAPGVAEHIIYTPEVWLPITGGKLSDQYNALTSLPPVL